jgi:hypothetical protein
MVLGDGVVVYEMRNSTEKRKVWSECSIVSQRCCWTRTEAFVGGGTEMGSGLSAATKSDKRRASEDALLGGEDTGIVMVAWDPLYPTEFVVGIGQMAGLRRD